MTNRTSCILEPTAARRHPPEARRAIENTDCLLCVGVRFTDVATGFFSDRLHSDKLIHIRAFEATIGTVHITGSLASKC